MKFILQFFLQILFLLIVHLTLASGPKAGFFLPENVSSVTLKFQNVQNLVVLPVTINDTIKINLILDTGCRNLVLFGKRFQKLFHIEPDKKIQFSGLGNGKPIMGKLSLGNKISIHTVIGEKIPVVIVPQENLFSAHSNVHGIIGYDIFIKFEIELRFADQLITFRSAANSEISDEYIKVPLRIKDSRPLINSHIIFAATEAQPCDLMMDTGSTLGLLIKTTDLKKFPKRGSKKILGRGLNGEIIGIETVAEKLILDTFEIDKISASITYSAWHNYASIGMDIMKNYSVILNYCKAYAGFKKSVIGIR